MSKDQTKEQKLLAEVQKLLQEISALKVAYARQSAEYQAFVDNAVESTTKYADTIVALNEHHKEHVDSDRQIRIQLNMEGHRLVARLNWINDLREVMGEPPFLVQ